MELALWILTPVLGMAVGFVLGCAACGVAHRDELAQERGKCAELETVNAMLCIQLGRMGSAVRAADRAAWDEDYRLSWEELERINNTKRSA